MILNQETRCEGRFAAPRIAKEHGSRSIDHNGTGMQDNGAAVADDSGDHLIEQEMPDRHIINIGAWMTADISAIIRYVEVRQVGKSENVLCPRPGAGHGNFTIWKAPMVDGIERLGGCGCAQEVKADRGLPRLNFREFG